jgi:hypothetical protein
MAATSRRCGPADGYGLTDPTSTRRSRRATPAPKQPPAGVWDGDVPAPVSPGEDVEAGEPEPDQAAEKPTG